MIFIFQLIPFSRSLLFSLPSGLCGTVRQMEEKRECELFSFALGAFNFYELVFYSRSRALFMTSCSRAYKRKKLSPTVDIKSRFVLGVGMSLGMG